VAPYVLNALHVPVTPPHVPPLFQLLPLLLPMFWFLPPIPPQVPVASSVPSQVPVAPPVLPHVPVAPPVPPNVLVASPDPPNFLVAPSFLVALNVPVASHAVVKVEETVTQNEAICLSSDDKDDAEDGEFSAKPALMVQNGCSPFYSSGEI